MFGAQIDFKWIKIYQEKKTQNIKDLQTLTRYLHKEDTTQMGRQRCHKGVTPTKYFQVPLFTGTGEYILQETN